MDQEPGLSHPDGGQVHLHRRRAVHGVARGTYADVDPAGAVRAGEGRWQLRVPGVHRTQDEPLRGTQRHQ